MDNGRDNQGRFAAGNRGGPGRPKQATEAEYLKALSRIVSLDDLRAIARRAVADAKKGSARARDWVSRYLLGDPVPRAHSSTDRRQEFSQAFLQSVREEIAIEQATEVPAE